MEDELSFNVKDRVDVADPYDFRGTIVDAVNGLYYVVADGDNSCHSDAPFESYKLKKVVEREEEFWFPHWWFKNGDIPR